MTDFPDISGFVEGAAHELTSDNDALGVIMFGDCWPAVKARLCEAEDNPRETYVVRVTAVADKPTVRFTK